MTIAVIVFAILLGVYFIGIIIFSIVKYVSYKKKLDKEVNDETKQNKPQE